MGKKKKENPKGIGGLVLIPIISLSLGLLLTIFVLIDSILSYDFLIYPEITFFSFFDIFLFSVTLFCILKKLKVARTMGVITFSYLILINFIYYDFIYGSFWRIVISIIWLFYFIDSKRVKNTFVN